MMNKRVVSAIVGIVLLFLLLYIGGLPLRIGFIMLTLLCMMELKGTLGSSFRFDDFLSAIFVVLSYFLPWDLAMALGFVYLVISLGLSLMMSPMDLQRTYINSFSYFFVFFPFLLLYRLIAFSPIKYLYILPLILAWGNDTVAYYVGTYFGKTHYTTISPKKTVEGALGGLIGGLIIIAVAKAIFIKDISFITLIIYGVLGGIFAQAGDFFGSYIKRSAGVKDFGVLMPGHGGMLDRFISVMFATVLLYLMHNFF
ncbi:MAG: phosphatidate cytidylyltransferase [Tissierellia bacterium]|nr:phosphatidate cytidylyltransferase [Tissierellia bacterium]